jgi:hypothetical protein
MFKREGNFLNTGVLIAPGPWLHFFWLVLVNPLKPKFTYIIFNNSILVAVKTQMPVTKIIWLVLFKEVIPVYIGNRMKPMNTKCRVIDC